MTRYDDRTGNRLHPGDELASGGRSAVFTGPVMKFDEGIMRDDLKKMPSEEFITKYMITQREYDLMSSTRDEETINGFAKEMATKAAFYERGINLDEAQAESLKRECFIEPYVPIGEMGKVIVDRDEPLLRDSLRSIIIPQRLQKAKTLLPTTGHIIKAVVFKQAPDGSAVDISNSFMGRRVLFGQMSGSAICFKGYPTWTMLDLAEIMGWVKSEQVEVEEIPLEPMV
jgi:hypothetical protein